MHDLQAKKIKSLWLQDLLQWGKYCFSFDIGLKLFLLLITSIVIGYMLSPIIFFDRQQYKVDETASQDIILHEDILLLDSISTQLKKEHLLSQVNFPYTYNPDLHKSHRKKLKDLFANITAKASLYEQQASDLQQQRLQIGKNNFLLSQKIKDVQDDFTYYKKIQSLWQLKQATLEKQQRKNKHDATLINRIKITKTQLGLINTKLHNTVAMQNELWQQRKAMRETIKTFTKENEDILTHLDSERQSVKQGFITNTQLAVNLKSFSWVGNLFYNPKVIDAVLSSIQTIEAQYKIAENPKLDEHRNWEILNIKTNKTTYTKQRNSFLSLSEAKDKLKPLIEAKLTGVDKATLRKVALFLAQALLRSNMQENESLFQEHVQTILHNLSPVYFNLRKGAFLVHKGERLTKQKVNLLNTYTTKFSYTNQIPRLLGIVLLVFVSFLISGLIFLNRNLKTWKIADFILITSSILLTLFLIKLGILLKEMLVMRYGALPHLTYEMIFPIALGAMISSILLNRKAGLMSAILCAFFTSVLLQSNINYLIFLFIVASVGTLPIYQFNSRYAVFRHTFKVFITSIIVALVLFLINWRSVSLLTLWYIPATALGALITAILVSVLLPFYEAIFDITTNLKLLELSTMNHPALKRLVLNAPGTYQHSLIVGNLVESAATKIGANPLLARVGSYFHDLGKGEHPEYFIENQYGNNIHDTLDPYESAKFVIQHLQDGERIANKYRLGSALKGILLQHHGTMITRFFYEKAKQQYDGDIDIKAFQYDGPKPQTLEAALVMLADSAEASTRTLESPTYKNIYAMVEKVCNFLRDSKQLDESGLTIAQYKIIIEDYTKVLTNMYHRRIKYPDTDADSTNTAQYINSAKQKAKNMHYYFSYNND